MRCHPAGWGMPGSDRPPCCALRAYASPCDMVSSGGIGRSALCSKQSLRRAGHRRCRFFRAPWARMSPEMWEALHLRSAPV
eukprot:3980357-Amphidinium_carterae.1